MVTFARDPRAGARSIKIEEVGWSERETHQLWRSVTVPFPPRPPDDKLSHKSPSTPLRPQLRAAGPCSEEAVGGAEAWAPPTPPPRTPVSLRGLCLPAELHRGPGKRAEWGPLKVSWK